MNDILQRILASLQRIAEVAPALLGAGVIFFAGYSFEYVKVDFGSTAFGNVGGIFSPGTQ